MLYKLAGFYSWSTVGNTKPIRKLMIYATNLKVYGKNQNLGKVHDIRDQFPKKKRLYWNIPIRQYDFNTAELREMQIVNIHFNFGLVCFYHVTHPIQSWFLSSLFFLSKLILILGVLYSALLDRRFNNYFEIFGIFISLFWQENWVTFCVCFGCQDLLHNLVQKIC